MSLRIKQLSELGEKHREVVISTVRNLGLDMLFTNHGVKETDKPYNIAYRAVELLMDGLGDEVLAEESFIEEYNSMVKLLSKPKNKSKKAGAP